MTNHPKGLRKTARANSSRGSVKKWTVDGDIGQSAHALVRESKVKPGDTIDVQTANQLGSFQYLVVLDGNGNKSLKITYDPNYPEDYMGGGKSRKARKNTKSNRKRKGNTRKNRK